MAEIKLSVVRVAASCLQRWQQETDGRVQQLLDGELQADGLGNAQQFDDGRLNVPCNMGFGITIYLAAEPHEWSRFDQ